MGQIGGLLQDFEWKQLAKAHVAAAGFLSRYMNGSLPYVRRHITIYKMCWVRR